MNPWVFYLIKETFTPSAMIGHLASGCKLPGARAHSIADQSIAGKLRLGALLSSWQLSSMGQGRVSRPPSGENVVSLKPVHFDYKKPVVLGTRKRIAFSPWHVNGQVVCACLNPTMRSELQDFFFPERCLFHSEMWSLHKSSGQFCGVIFHYPILQEVFGEKKSYLTFLSHWDAF